MSRSTCTQPNCSRPRRYAGLCAGHHWRKENGKPMDTPFRTYRLRSSGDRPCTVPGCRNDEGRAKGLCDTHYRLKKSGAPNWQRRIRRHRPVSESADVMVRLPLTVVAKLKARAAARGLTVAEVARSVLEVSL